MADVGLGVDANVITEREVLGAGAYCVDACLSAFAFVAARAAMFVAGCSIDARIATIDHRRGTNHSFAVTGHAGVIACARKATSSAIFGVIVQR